MLRRVRLLVQVQHPVTNPVFQYCVPARERESKQSHKVLHG